MTQASLRLTPIAPFDSLTLCAVASELSDCLVGGQLQDVRQPSPSELLLGIRNRGRNYLLALSCDARFARVHLTQRKQPNAASPPSFCMSLRKHCEGAIVRTVQQREFDRVLDIEIGSRSEEADAATVTLVAELMGKHSNLILVNGAGTILEAAKRITRKVSRFREVYPGLPYAPPPTQEGRLDPFSAIAVKALETAMRVEPAADPASRSDWLFQHIAGISPFLAREIALRLFNSGKERIELAGPVWSSIFDAAARGAFDPIEIFDGGRTVSAYPFPLVSVSRDAQRSVSDLNAALDSAYGGAVAGAAGAALVSDLRGRIDRDRKRYTRQREAAERALQESERAEDLKQAGELVLANLGRIEPGAAGISVQDYFDPELRERTITLDPKISGRENADALFRRYRKIRDGKSSAEARRSEAIAQIQRLDSARAALMEVQAGENDAATEIRTITEDLRSSGLLLERGGDGEQSTPVGPDLQGHKIRRFMSPEGYEIYLGETATANDYLTLRLAAPSDLWFHVRASTSAHVVLKTRGKPADVPRSVIENAALLCARHSSQKHSGLVPVDYTLKKYVRKPRGAAPGSADYSQETTLHVTP